LVMLAAAENVSDWIDPSTIGAPVSGGTDAVVALDAACVV